MEALDDPARQSCIRDGRWPCSDLCTRRSPDGVKGRRRTAVRRSGRYVGPANTNSDRPNCCGHLQQLTARIRRPRLDGCSWRFHAVSAPRCYLHGQLPRALSSCGGDFAGCRPADTPRLGRTAAALCSIAPRLRGRLGGSGLECWQQGEVHLGRPARHSVPTRARCCKRCKRPPPPPPAQGSRRAHSAAQRLTHPRPAPATGHVPLHWLAWLAWLAGLAGLLSHLRHTSPTRRQRAVAGAQKIFLPSTAAAKWAHRGMSRFFLQTGALLPRLPFSHFASCRIQRPIRRRPTSAATLGAGCRSLSP